ncbi:MAG: DUF1579 domain-containing protein [Gemmatimonadetes bacterium]|nr:DUF1579 domain-containing protein [Gemmatimonadota bacterium]
MMLRLVTCGPLIAALLVPAAARTQQPDSAMMMEKWQQYMTPGPPHQQMAKEEGEWTWKSTFWPGPGAPAEESSGAMSARTIMGGRYLMQNWTGTAMQMPFEGQSLSGYDNAKGQYFDVWVDNFGTGVMTSWGTRDDATGTMSMSGSAVDPATGREQKMRSVTRHVDDDHFILEMYAPAPDGKEFKSMELHALRKE